MGIALNEMEKFVWTSARQICLGLTFNGSLIVEETSLLRMAGTFVAS
jgi:hypothetical protein